MVRGNYAAYCIFAQHFTNTIDAMSSDGSVRRPRIRTDSERDRRRQYDSRANYAHKRITFKTKSRVWHEKHKSSVACKRRGHRQRDALKLSTRDGVNEKQIAEKHFYLIFSVAKNRFVTETKTLLLTQDTKQPEGRAVCRA